MKIDETFSRGQTYSGCMNEETLIQNVLDGDQASFAPLVERYHVGLIIYCDQFVHDRAAAEDIAQEAFIKAYQKLSIFNASKARFSTWLYKIGRSTALDYLRSRKKHVDIDELPDLEATTGSLSQQQKSDIREAVTQLEPPIYRSVIEEFYWEGNDYQTIADRHNIPLNTVRTHIRRAKAKLKGVLA